MSDTLPKLLQEIHSVKTPSELNSRFPEFQSRIAAILFEQPSEENYYVNHTGRELFRKLYNYGLEHLITDPYDSGFRPILESGIQPFEAFTVTVNGNNGVETGGGQINIGSTINITASPNDLYQFDSWTVVGPGQIGSTTSANTTFTVGAGNVTITANYSIVPAPVISAQDNQDDKLKVLITVPYTESANLYRLELSTSSDFTSMYPHQLGVFINQPQSGSTNDIVFEHVPDSITTYYYRARAEAGATVTDWSNTESITTKVWTPSEVSTASWFDASDSSDTSKIIQSSSLVSTWKNLGTLGSNSNLAQSTASLQPTLASSAINGLDTIEFTWNQATSTNNSFLETSSGFNIFGNTSSANEMSIFYVAKTLTLSKSLGFSLTNSTKGTTSYFNAHLPWGNGVFYIDINDNDATGRSFGPAISANDEYIINFQNSASRSLRKHYKNGVDVTQGTGTNKTIEPSATSSFKLGNRTNFQLGEFINYNIVVSDSLRKKTEGYLAYKWGQTLPAGHVYETDQPLAV
jgi:hypothetical protein